MDVSNLDKHGLGISVFYSYAPEDELLQRGLEMHLATLRHEKLIREWHMRRIWPGKPRQAEIDAYIGKASLILLLVSPAFIASDYYYGVELKRILERQQAGAAMVIPIILRPVDWEHTQFAHLQYLPRNKQPVSTWHNLDTAFYEIAQEIRQIIQQQALSINVQGPSVDATLQRDYSQPVAPPLQFSRPSTSLEASIKRPGISRRAMLIGAAGIAVVSVAGIILNHNLSLLAGIGNSPSSTPTSHVASGTQSPSETTATDTLSSTATVTGSTYKGTLRSDTSRKMATMKFSLDAPDPQGNFKGTMVVYAPLSSYSGTIEGLGADNSSSTLKFDVLTENIQLSLITFIGTIYAGKPISGTYYGTSTDSSINYLESGSWQATLA